MADNSEFTFEISLSVLDHLGRHLYRSFATVLGEAISNAWDADAKLQDYRTTRLPDRKTMGQRDKKTEVL